MRRCGGVERLEILTEYDCEKGFPDRQVLNCARRLFDGKGLTFVAAFRGSTKRGKRFYAVKVGIAGTEHDFDLFMKSGEDFENEADENEVEIGFKKALVRKLRELFANADVLRAEMMAIGENINA